MEDILVIGSGAREQALAWKLAASKHVKTVYVAPGNAGSKGNIQNVAIGFTDTEKLLQFAKDNNISLTVIGQEAASAAGVVDAFLAFGLKIFGPTQAATLIESSKVFSKTLMEQEHIPTAQFKTFTDPKQALAYARSRTLPVVVKADGLATGKGVIIGESIKQIETAIHDIMERKIFGESGNSIVIEDFLTGQEVSVHALCDGKKTIVFPASQDHKQIYDGDRGPNTGGMGVIAPVSWVKQSHIDYVKKHIVEPALSGLNDFGTPFNGCLYPGLMIDGDAVQLLEFNARFGDPEAEVYMRLLDGDLYEILLACSEGRLDPESIKWIPGFAVSVVASSPGYPGDYVKGLEVTGIEAAEQMKDIVIFHAGTALRDGQIVTAGGRVLNVTATGPTLKSALDKAYKAMKKIHFDGMHYRTDIGKRTS